MCCFARPRPQQVLVPPITRFCIARPRPKQGPAYHVALSSIDHAPSKTHPQGHAHCVFPAPPLQHCSAGALRSRSWGSSDFGCAGWEFPQRGALGLPRPPTHIRAASQRRAVPQATKGRGGARLGPWLRAASAQHPGARQVGSGRAVAAGPCPGCRRRGRTGDSRMLDDVPLPTFLRPSSASVHACISPQKPPCPGPAGPAVFGRVRLGPHYYSPLGCEISAWSAQRAGTPREAPAAPSRDAEATRGLTPTRPCVHILGISTSRGGFPARSRQSMSF